jgi:hypothetical protein
MVAITALAGCGNKPLHDIRQQGNGPDEFSIIPAKPMTAPEDYAFLPPPTPGGVNRTDRDPSGEAIVALGGKPSASNAGGIPSSDAALVTASSRYGVEQNVRGSLAAEDADFRKRQGRMTQIKLFPVDRYEQVYRKQKLDPFYQSERYRRAGAITPTSPPPQ